jgi:hypothetical protein
MTVRSSALGGKLRHQGGDLFLEGGDGRLLSIRPTNVRRRLRLMLNFREVDRDARTALIVENPWQVQPASKSTGGMRAHPEPLADLRIG